MQSVYVISWWEEKQLKIEAEERANALEEEVQRLRKLLESQEQK